MTTTEAEELRYALTVLAEAVRDKTVCSQDIVRLVQDRRAGLSSGRAVNDPFEGLGGCTDELLAHFFGPKETVTCPFCGGNGKHENTQGVPCVICHGAGQVTIPKNFVTCRACDGTGRSSQGFCRGCMGVGRAPVKKSFPWAI